MKSKKVPKVREIYGRLTVVVCIGRKGISNYPHWSCLCSCGNKIQVRADALSAGTTVLCGCFQKQTARDKMIKLHFDDLNSVGNIQHGLSGTVEYHAWEHMKQRCLNLGCQQYADYGGRGIIICDRWLNSFENFIVDMGEKPWPKKLYSFDRVDNDGNYTPENCRWVTQFQQNSNKRKGKGG